jgi:hypothetical protein
LDDEEKWRLEEEKILEEENRLRFEEGKKFRAEQERKATLEAEKKKNSREFMNSAHMRRYRQRLGPTKWTDGSRDVSSYYWSKKYIKSHRKRPHGIVDPDMTGLLKYVETWEEV